jgi:hypothetical protein
MNGHRDKKKTQRKTAAGSRRVRTCEQDAEQEERGSANPIHGRNHHHRNDAPPLSSPLLSSLEASLSLLMCVM